MEHIPSDDPFAASDEPADSPDNFKPWEQRIGPGMSGGGGAAFSNAAADDTPEQLDKLSRACQEIDAHELPEVINPQADLAHLPMVNGHTTPDTDLAVTMQSDADAWKQFVSEHLYDTRRVTLEHFHLFEWFPLSPGKFHTLGARQQRQSAYASLAPRTEGARQVYFNPMGKASMVKGGVGAVRLRPRLVDGEPHYFMTASSRGVCHEGFPVLLPRRFYGPLKQRMLKEGAVPVTLSGEMRYVPREAVTFFGNQRDVPLLYLHVDDVQVLSAPRSDVTAYYVSVAASFVGEFQGHGGSYVTYATFDPAQPDSLSQVSEWLEQYYVETLHKGVVITDFDEVHPRFPQAVFGLPDLMAGKLNDERVRQFLKTQGLDEQSTHPYFLIYKEINTMGGAYIAGDVHAGGDFIGRDQNVGSET